MSGPALVQSSSPCSTCLSSLDGGSCPADPYPSPASLVCLHLTLQPMPLLMLFTPPTVPSLPSA